jgi:hypothetical protein
VDIGRIAGTTEYVPLEIHPDTASEARRFRVIGQNPLLVVEVAKGAVGQYMPDHRHDCSMFNAGR